MHGWIGAGGAGRERDKGSACQLEEIEKDSRAVDAVDQAEQRVMVCHMMPITPQLSA